MAVEKAPDAFRTISEVAVDLDVPQHVLRFWESRFREIKPMKRGGGRRYYRPDDIALLRGIRHLLYGQGYTIRGVQRIFKDQGPRFVQSIWQPGAAKLVRRPADESDFASDDMEARDQNEIERGRGLFSLLPSLLSGDDDEQPVRRELPPAQQEPRPASSQRLVPPVPVPRAIPRDDLRKLQAVLQDLVECRALIDAVLSERN